MSNHDRKYRVKQGPELVAVGNSVPFQLAVDLCVATPNAAKFLRDPGVNSEERRLFNAIVSTPEALNRICRLAVVCDLQVQMGDYYRERFTGADPDDIFKSILPCLSPDVADFWTRLRDSNNDEFEASINFIFEQFETSLKKTAVIDVANGESIPLRVSSRLA